MAAPAYEYEALSPLFIGGVLAYAPGDLVPASVVEAQGWRLEDADDAYDIVVRRRDPEELDGAQATADERVPDDSTGEPPFGAADDVLPNETPAEPTRRRRKAE